VLEEMFGSTKYKRKQILFHMWYSSCNSCYKPGDKLRMGKGSNCDFRKLNLQIVEGFFRKQIDVLLNSNIVCTLLNQTFPLTRMFFSKRKHLCL
jgi:hypothetical protein